MRRKAMNGNHAKACIWLIEFLRVHPYKTRKEICEEWAKSKKHGNGVEMSERSFHRYRKSLKENFGVEICCKDGGDFPYYIKDTSILCDNNLPEWILNTMAVGEKLQSCLSLMHRIRLEPIPSGGNKLDIVTDAMLADCKLKFDYLPYGAVKIKTNVLGVCGLVLYNQRWYILGEYDDRKRYTYALDRMSNLEIQKEHFEVDPNFDVNEYFGEFYGFFNSGSDFENIIIRAFDTEPYYLRDLPIHKSQREIGSGEGYSDFVIRVRPNNELISYLIARKNRLKVLSPDSFVREMEMAAASICKNYDMLNVS